MKKFDNFRVYAWGEFALWLLVIAIVVIGFRYNNYKNQGEFKHYQIFMEDVDGLIVGSPVRFLGVQVGHVKKIQILPSEVYIKFVITQPELLLPSGSIATIEASGLAGSKSLEIYPPDPDNETDKLITVKEPTRLNKVIGLFDSMFKELDAIITTVSHASAQFDSKNSDTQIKNVITPADANSKLDDFNKSLDNFAQKKRDFMKKFNYGQKKE